ncbi:MAG: tetratricopeptide repeat protein [Pseudomonadota bacterium]
MQPVNSRHPALYLLLFAALTFTVGFTFPKKKGPGEFVAELKENIRKTDGAIAVVDDEIRKSIKKSIVPGLMLRLAELRVEKARYLYFLAREQNPGSVKKVSDVAAAVTEKEKAIEVYRKILQNYPQDLNSDKVTFFIAQEYGQLGQETEELRYYQNLIRHYPGTEFRNDVLLILGDKEFDARRINEAAKYYAKVLEGEETPMHNMARYKLAWVRINQQNCGEALALFEAVAKSRKSTERRPGEVGKKQGGLQRESLVDSVICFTKVRKPEDSVTYYRNLATSNKDLVAVLDKLANRYYIQKQVKEAVPIYRELARRTSDVELENEYLLRLFGNLRLIDYAGPIDQDAVLLIDHLTRYLNSWRIPKKERQQAALQFELYLRDAATRLQMMGKQRNDVALLRRAAATYEQYLNLFKSAPKAPQMILDRAESLYATGDYLGAAKGYLELAERGKSGTEVSDWTHSAVAAYFEALKKPDSLSKVELIQARHGFLRSADLFLTRFPTSSQAPDIQFTIGRIHYDENNWDLAIEHLSRFVFRYPTDKNAVTGGRLLLDAYNMKDNLQGMVGAGKQILAQGAIRDPRFLSDVRDVVSRAEFKKVEESLDRPGGASSDTSVAFFKISEEYKGTEVGEKALYNAFVTAKQMARPILMARSAEQLHKQYPSSKFLEEVLPILAQSMVEAGQFELGAQRFEEFQAKYPRSPAGGNALLTAGRIRGALRQYGLAARDFTAALQSPQVDRSEVLRSWAGIANDSESWRELEATAGRLRAADPSDPKGLVWLVKAQIKGGKTAEALRTIPQARTYVQRIADPAERTTLSAELAYWEAEVTYQKFERVQVVKGHREDSVVEQKAKLLEAVETKYTNVAGAGSGTWAIAAMYQVAKAYSEFARFLGTTSVPKGLAPSQAAQYRALIRGKVDEVDRNAKTLYAACSQKAHEFKLYTEEALGCAMGRRISKPAIPAARNFGGADLARLRALVSRLMDNPRDIDALNNLARLNLDTGNIPPALLILARASEIDNSRADTKNLMGVAFERLGKYQDAYVGYSTAVERDPRLKSARANLAAFCVRHQDRVCAQNAISGVSRDDLKRIPRSDLAPDARP